MFSSGLGSPATVLGLEAIGVSDNALPATAPLLARITATAAPTTTTGLSYRHPQHEDGYEFGLLPGCQLRCTYRYVVASKSCAAFDACGHLIHASTNEFRVRGKAKKTNAPTRAVTAVIPETMIASSALAMFRITRGQAPQPINRSPQLTAGNTP